MQKKEKRKRKITLVAICIFLFLFVSTPIHGESSNSTTKIDDSGSWRPDDTEIYGESDGTVIKEDDQDSKPGVVEGLLITILVTVGDFFDWLFKALSIDLKSIIYGRVDGAGVQFDGYRISLFTFELSYGNPYGIIGSAVYGVLRGIIFIVIACISFAILVFTLFIGNSAKAVAKLKENFSTMFLALLLLIFMPYLLDLFLYIRDIGIHLIGVDLFHTLGMDTPDITSFFKENAEKDFMFSLMYTGSFALAVYFLMQYVGIALSFVVYMFAFPFVCVNMQFDKRTLGVWLRGVFNNAMIPVIDCCLLLVPAMFGLLGGSLPIKVVQLAICTMFIPARGEFRKATGMLPGGGMELSGLLAMRGAMSFAGAAIGGTVGSISGMVGANQDAKQDEKMANFYESLSKNGIRSGIRTGGFSSGDTFGGYDFSSSGIGGDFQPQTMGAGVQANRDMQENGDILEPVDGKAYEPQDIADHFANINNFEDRAFAGMSNERKAQLYRERAAEKRRQAIGTMVGGLAGTATGMTAGLGASMFFSGGAKGEMMGALGSVMGGAGRNLGSSIHYGQLKSHFGAPFFSKAPTINTFNGMTSDTTAASMDRNEGTSTSSMTSMFPLQFAEFEMDYPDVEMMGKSYAEVNAPHIQAASYSVLDFQNNDEIRAKMDSAYNTIRMENTNMSADEQYNKFRSTSQDIIQREFTKKYMNAELKSCGNEQMDQGFHREVQNKFKEYIASAENISLSRTNMELHGWKF